MGEPGTMISGIQFSTHNFIQSRTSKLASPMTILTILQRSTPFGLFLPYAMLKHTLTLNDVQPPQCKSFDGLSILNSTFTDQKQMGMAIGQLHRIGLSWIYFRELYLSFRCDSYEFYTSSQGELLYSGCQSVIHNNSICIECSPHNASIELPSPFFHSPDQINHRQSFVVFKFLQHFSDGYIFLVNIVHFNKLGQLASREQKVICFPQLVFISFDLTDFGCLQFILCMFLLFMFFKLPIFILMLSMLLILFQIT